MLVLPFTAINYAVTNHVTTDSMVIKSISKIRMAHAGLASFFSDGLFMY